MFRHISNSPDSQWLRMPPAPTRNSNKSKKRHFSLATMAMNLTNTWSHSHPSLFPPLQSSSVFHLLRFRSHIFLNCFHRPNECSWFPDTENPFIGLYNLDSSSSSHNVACQDSGYRGLMWRQPDTAVQTLLPVKGSSFPRPAQFIFDTIGKNRNCQKIFHNRLVLIEALIEENNKLQECVKISMDFRVSMKKVRLGTFQKKDPLVQLILSQKSSEKQVKAMTFGPEDNKDTANYRDAKTKFIRTSLQKKWSEEKRGNLRKGIKQEFQKALLEKSVDLMSGSDKCYGTFRDIDNVMASIKGLDITPENIREYLPKVNWDEFASIHNQGHSGAECETRWLNWEDPLKNNTKWTKKEDKELLVIVKDKEMSNWIDIAVSLGTNRTPFQCLSRFQRSLNTLMVKREWEEEEDARLNAAVKVFGEKNWENVASVLDRRTAAQCCYRWKSSLNPDRVRVGRWTADEDKHLKVSAQLLGAKCWDKLSQFVPGRTQVQCRERWVNCLNPLLKWDPWTEDEDMKLISAAKEYNYCWTKVSTCIPPRTDNQCRRRWMVLCPDDVLKLKADKKIRQAVLVSNFVGRPTERPDLGPEDVSLPPPTVSPVSKPNSEQLSRKRKRKPCEKPASQITDNGKTNIEVSLKELKKILKSQRRT